MASYILVLKKEYGLDRPVSATDEKVTTTEAGNTIREKELFFENEEVVARMITSTVTPAEKDLQDGLNDEVELMLFSREENPGISAAALQKGTEDN